MRRRRFAAPAVRQSVCNLGPSPALVGLGVVVAALQRHPVGDQILGAVEIRRPGIASHKAARLPHHVELTVSPHLADEDRLGDVVVRAASPTCRPSGSAP